MMNRKLDIEIEIWKRKYKQLAEENEEMKELLKSKYAILLMLQ